MKSTLMVILKPKLITLDNILPLIFELKATGHGWRRMLFVFPSVVDYRIFQRNRFLVDSVKHVGGTTVYLNKGKLRFINLWKLRHYLTGKVISAENTVNVGYLISLLANINRRIWKGKRILCYLPNYPIKQAIAIRKCNELTKKINRGEA